MKKTLIALAVGAAFVAPAAYADVTLSGSINMGIAYVKSGDQSTNPTGNTFTGPTTGGGSLSNTQLTSNYSNITIGSLEDLGGGLKLDFAFQMDPNLTNNGAVFNRNSHIGLVGDSWGGVWYGTNEMLYESYYYTIDPLDGAAGLGGNLQMLGTPGYGTVFDVSKTPPNGPAGPSGAGFYRRDAQSLWYNSPNFGGITFGVYTTMSAYKTAAGLDPKIYGGGVKYVGPTLPIQAWVAYEQHNDLNGLDVIAGGPTGATSSKDTGIQVGAGYTLGDIFLFANYEQLKYKSTFAIGDAEYKRNAFSLGVKWNVATGYFGAQYIQAQDATCTIPGATCNADETGARMVGLGYYHTMSKQTQAYVVGTVVDNKDLASYTLAGAGAPHLTPGSKQSAITIGLKHSF
jgi:predicted porin